MPTLSTLFSLRTILLLATIFIGLSAWGNTSYDPDLGWHLFGGAWIWNHQQLPVHDSINFLREFWHDYHWAGQLVLYISYSISELDSLRVLVGVSGAVLGFLLFTIAERSGSSRPSPFRSFALALISLMIIRPYLLPRPQIFAFLLIASLVLLVIRESIRLKDLLSAIFITIVCVWVHIYWVLFPLIWFTGLLLPSIFKGQSKPIYFVGLVLLSFAGILDPYVAITGNPIIAYRLVWEYLVMPDGLKQHIGEMRRMSQITSQEIISVLPLLFAALIGACKRKCEMYLSGLFLLAFGLSLTAIMLKFLPIFVICALPSAVLGSMWVEGKILSSSRFISTNLLRFLAGISIFVSLLIAVAGSPLLYDSNRNLWAYLPRELCEEVVSLGSTENTGKTIRVLTHFNDGGWCRWFAYMKDQKVDVRVSTDGRTQNYPPEIIMKSFDIFATEGNWINVLESWHVDFAVVPKDTPLSQQLESHPGFMPYGTSRFHRLFKRQ